MQRQQLFFKDGHQPSTEQIEDHLSHPDCPLNKIIVSADNEGNMEILNLFAHTAFKLQNHSCRGMSFAIYSSAGQGKTHIVRNFAATIGIPFVFVQSDALVDNSHLLNQIITAFADTSTPIVEYPPDHFTIPPCFVFLDEIHALNPRVMDGLLNAMEFNDGHMRITIGKKSKARTVVVNCREICWVGATTEEGKLPGPFASRLETSIVWKPAGPEEIVEIIRMHFPEFPEEACQAVAKYRDVPRTAVAFARLMQMSKSKSDCSWEEAADTIAKNMDLDEYGMQKRQVEVLTALGQRPISKSTLSLAVKCNIEALEKVVLPPLMESLGGGPLIVPTRKGYALTKIGLAELDKRHISHKGERVTVEYIEGAD